MPIYGYECTACGHNFELFRSISDPPLEECPECGGKVRKLLYPVGVIFKGSGFYSTDYKSTGKSGANGSSSSESSGSSEAKPSGTEAKTSSEGTSKSESKSDSASSD
jgi:putative FmdB family regulatory protein